MTLIHHLSEQHMHQLLALYKQAWWARERDLEDTRRIVQGSQVCVGLTDSEDNLMAFARVITDFASKALILDVIVDASARGRGLGHQLVEAITAHESLQRVKHFELYCQPEMHDFYQSHGFTTELGGIVFMRHVRESHG